MGGSKSIPCLKEDIMVPSGSVIIKENTAHLIHKVKDLGARNLRRERDQDV